MNRQQLWQEVDDLLDLGQPPLPPAALPIGRRRRRAFSAAELDVRATLQLVRDAEGVLRFNYEPPRAGTRNRRRAYRATHIEPVSVVKEFRFHELGGNDVTTALQALDARLTPERGLRQWLDGRLQPFTTPPTGPVLLLVHGTFSKSDMFFDELAATPQGRARLAAWAAHYGAILAFDHPTLSVGAWYNAVDLMQALQPFCGPGCGPIDVLCHSRGGLVVSWLLRLRALAIRQVVFVGSPLTGTSLASPPKLRAALDLIANVAEAAASLGTAASAVVPLAAGAAGLARIFGGVLRLGSSLPVIDAGVSLVPGLATQQRTSNNLEIQQLFAATWQTAPRLAGIGVHFQPDESMEGWKFWKRFTHIGDQLKYAGADLVFRGENDLVVDVEAMSQLGQGGRLDDFVQLPASATVHHTSYFRDEAVLGFLGGRLA